MILLLGGTSETRPIAQALAESGLRVLASTATDNELDVGDHPNIERRIGRLDGAAMAALMEERGIALLLDAAHPYAAALHRTAREAAALRHAPYLRYERASVRAEAENILYAGSHEEAALIAFGFGRPVLLTTGSRNLAPYVAQARGKALAIVARVLPHAESEEACRNAGLLPAEVIAARGPFSTEENLATMRARGIGVLVTKESGAAGGVAEKYEAARIAGCRVVVVGRPPAAEGAFESIEAVVAAAKEFFGR